MNRCVYDGDSIRNQRKSNMDSLLLKEREIAGEPVYMAIVCDGVGSMADGAFAASAAVRRISEWFDGLGDTLRIGLRLRDVVLEIDREITAIAGSRGLQTASTLSALLLAGGRFYIVHAGDSRIYGYRDGELLRLTQDDTSEDGKLTAYIGRGRLDQLFYNEGIVEHKLFLLCSDGLYKRMDEMYLQAELERAEGKNLHKCIERLVQYVIDRGEKDNISLALVKCES